MVSSDKTSKTPSKTAFLTVAAVIFASTLSAADSIGFVPYYVDGTEPTRSRIALDMLPELGEEETNEPAVQPASLPTRIRSAAIDLDLPVSNPESRDIDELYEVIKDGPARYVDSARLGEAGNVLIFGHSSQLPVVYNQMYKAFNKVPDLKPGDTITVEGGGKEFVYSVLSIRSVDAEEGFIDLTKTGNRLTLVTCDTLSGKTARFVLEAELVGTI